MKLKIQQDSDVKSGLVSCLIYVFTLYFQLDMWKNEICTLSFVVVVYLLPSSLLSFSSSLYHQVSILNSVKMTEKVDMFFSVISYKSRGQ